MSLDGSLEDFGLSDVLQLIHIGKRTGILWVASNDKVAEIYFKDGEVIHAVMDEETGESAIYKIFNWRSGQFKFETKLVSVPETITIGSQNLILEATRRIDEWAKLRDLIPSSKTVLTFAVEPRVGSENITLEPQEWRILSLIDGQRSVEEIAELSGFSELKTTTILYGLVSSGLLNVAEEKEIEEVEEDEKEEDKKGGFLSFVERIGGAFGSEAVEQYDEEEEGEFTTKIGIVVHFINLLLEEIETPDGLYNPVDLPKDIEDKVDELSGEYPVLTNAVVEDDHFNIRKTEANTNRLDELSKHEFLLGLNEIIEYIYAEIIYSSNRSAAMRRYNKIFDSVFVDGKKPSDLGLEGIIGPKLAK